MIFDYGHIRHDRERNGFSEGAAEVVKLIPAGADGKGEALAAAVRELVLPYGEIPLMDDRVARIIV